MSIRSVLRSLICFCSLAILVSGCEPKKPAVPSEEDGQIISMTKINVPNFNGSFDVYKMMYWSVKTKTEALVIVPTEQSGKYPLMVYCHGGNMIGQPVSHISPFANESTDNPTSDEQGLVNVANPSTSAVTLIPLYRGYSDSEGMVQGLYGDTLDTNNAIQAAMSKFPIQTNDIYLNGVSMGGGVVLKLASQRKDIRAVISVSPFVGWDIVGTWAEEHQSNEMAVNTFSNMKFYYGTFNPNNSVYKENSIEYQKIEAPTLILQGTGDTQVIWQTVETLANDMKEDKQTVDFVLYPNGNHGLLDQYKNDAWQEQEVWLTRYGFPLV